MGICLDDLNNRKARLAALITAPNTILGLVVLLSLLVYLLMAVRPVNLFENYGQPRLDGVYIIRNRPFNQVRLLVAFLLLGGLYLAGWIAVRQAGGRTAWLLVLAGALACALALLFMMPFDSADLFDNIVHGRIFGVYGQNPFVFAGRSFPKDPFYRYMAWKLNPSAYGSLWELLAGAVARLPGEGIIANIIIFKLIPGLFWGASLFLAGLILKRFAPGQALAGVYLLALNPNVLFSTWGNGHNDMVMVFWMLLAVWLISTRRFTFAVLALVVGALIKYIPILLLPAAGLMAWIHLQSKGKRLRFVVLGAICAVGLMWLSYLPFWSGPEILTLERRAGLFTSSLPAVVYHIFSKAVDQELAGRWVSVAALIFTLGYTMWRAWRGQLEAPWPGFSQAAFDILAFYLLFTCLWFQQWYTIWLVGLAAALPFGHRQRFAAFFSLAALTKVLLFGPLLLSPKPKFPQPTLEILFTLSVLGLPWIYYLLKPKMRLISSKSMTETYAPKITR